MRRQKPKGKKDHHAGKDIKKDIRDPKTQGVDFPQPVINGITKDPDWLKGCGFSWGKHFFDIVPIQGTNPLILDNQTWVVPIDKIVF
jgi:hypothetical protein